MWHAHRNSARFQTIIGFGIIINSSMDMMLLYAELENSNFAKLETNISYNAVELIVCSFITPFLNYAYELCVNK